MRRTISLVLMAAALAGCSNGHAPLAGGGGTIVDPGGGGPLPQDSGAPAEDAAEDTGPPDVVDGYPGGPFGKAAGQNFPPFAFDGYDDGSLTWSKLDLRSYFDPDGSKGIRGVLVIVAAQWCGVCQEEAGWIPAEYTKTYKARGAKFVTVLIEDNVHRPATKLVADQWRDYFSIPFAVGIDPTMQTIPTDVGAISLPYTYVIDPRTMKIEKIYSAAITTPPSIPALDTVLSRNGG
jgi:hypothetical protein